ncbi:MAG: protein kinase [Ignavibacteriaceae bacterium]|nr:protein kinase [Ignavibacteriaceae bacterium]
MKQKFNHFIVIPIFFSLLFSTILFWGCIREGEKSAHSDHSTVHDPFVPDSWFKQTEVDLGKKIIMLSPALGYSITSGRGNINGQVLKFNGGTWDEISSHPYSDFPQISVADSNSLIAITHRTHFGNYKPVLQRITGGISQELPIALHMWDEIDFAMYKSLWNFGGNKFLAAGQQGYLSFFDGTAWNHVKSPVKRDTLKTLLSGDINSLYMFSQDSGWAVGKDGMILQCRNGVWNYYPSPTRFQLNSIVMTSSEYGVIAGDYGTVLEFDGVKWKKTDINSSERLTAVKAAGSKNIFICGSNSTLFHLYDGVWHHNKSLSIFEDSFNDMEVIQDENGKFLIWLIGEDGIYSNSSTLGFSFTNITQRAGLPVYGKGVLFIPAEDNFPDLLILNEGAKAAYYRNEKDKGFTPEQTTSGLINSINETVVASLSDINNDGLEDLFLLQNSKKFNLMLKKGEDEYILPYLPPSVRLKETEIYSIPSVQSADFNNDSYPDMYISIAEDNDQLLENRQGKKFIDRFDASGISKSIPHRSYGPVLSDFDNDGRVDIFIPYNLPKDGYMGELFINKGNFNFVKKECEAFLSGSSSSLATTIAVAFDANNDGWTDILLHHQKGSPHLFRNTGGADFQRINNTGALDSLIFHPEPLNGFMGTTDLNNDGWIDVIIGGRLFLNNQDLTFSEVNKQTGVSFTGNPSFADIDNDGDVDIFFGSSRWSFGKGERVALFRNNLNPSDYFKVSLIPSAGNTSLSGTALYITALKNGKVIYRQKREPGLGNAPMIPQNLDKLIIGKNPGYKYEIEVVFPSGIIRKIAPAESQKEIIVYEEDLLPRAASHLEKHLKNKIIEIKLAEEAGKILILIAQLFLLFYFIRIKLLEKYFLTSRLFLFFFFGLFLILNFSFSSITFFSKNILPVLSFIPAFWGFIFIRNSAIKADREKHLSHYRLDEKIGEGATCKVYSAYDVINKRRVALKVMNQELMDNEENKKRFNHEGMILTKIESRFVAKMYEYGEFEKKSYIAQELLTGGTLKDYISTSFPIPKERMKELLLSIASGLSEIHNAGIIHRDLKSTNILLDASGNARITDFGLSRSSLISSFTSAGTILGTLGFCSPEQITGSSVNHQTDIFSFGVIMYELATNKLPFSGDNEIMLIHSIFNDTPAEIGAFNPSISEFYRSVSLKCLEKNASDRYSDMQPLLNDLYKL